MEEALRYIKLAESLGLDNSGLDVIRGLLERGEGLQLSKMMKPLEFGTAGLRGQMGPGFGAMNEITVALATKGLAKHLMESNPEAASKGVVIGYDCRHNSDLFARITAHILSRSGIRAYLFRRFAPTPYVAFAVRHLSCAGGVVITASHNPREDNGYKVYGSAGSQILSPHDVSIAGHMAAATLTPDDVSPAVDHIEDPFDEVERAYLGTVRSKFFIPAEMPKTAVTYTAMHGVGTDALLNAFDACGQGRGTVHLVKEQCTPDGTFPTVAFPNPEEGKGALKLAMETAQRCGSKVILANDPDADRLAVAELSGDQWRVFTGNEIGALLGWWVVSQRDTSIPASKFAMLSSAVSSKILRSIASREGMYFEETLTGFKWMGTRTTELESKGYNVLLAFEEAIGFMVGTHVRDKDGITAAVVAAHMVNKLYAEGSTLSDALRNIFATYGRHVCYASYVISPDPDTTARVFSALPTAGSATSTLPTISNESNLVAIRDLISGVDTSKPDGKALLPTSKVSPMVTYTFVNGVQLTVRGSGTEPKIKWYAEAFDTLDSKQLQNFVDNCLKVIFGSESANLKARPTS